MPEDRSPPYRIETERLTLRCWDPADAPGLAEAIRTSLPELRRWMPWAQQEPAPVADVMRRLQGFRASFDRGEDFVYGILGRAGGEVLGGTGLHRRVGEGAFEIGYWVRSDRAGAGIATEAVMALTRTAFERCRVERLEIHVDAGNAASARIPARLGFTHDGTLRRRLPPVTARAPRGDAMIFSLLAEEFRGSPAAALPLAAYDAAGGALSTATSPPSE
jgi:RimJ/RimL family protein N-acetyltransferase